MRYPKLKVVQGSTLFFVLIFVGGNAISQQSKPTGPRPGIEIGIGEGLGYAYSLCGSILLNNRHNVDAGPCVILGTNPFKNAVGYGGLVEYNYFLKPFDKKGLNAHASANLQYRNNPNRELSYSRQLFTMVWAEGSTFACRNIFT